MKLKFCGAAGTVTGSCHYIELDNGFKMILDCGMYQGNYEDYANFNTTWYFNPSEIDCLILSHAHIDHCGRIPRLVKDGFNGDIISTTATRDLCAIMLVDSAKIQEYDAEKSNERRKKRGDNLVEPLYTIDDAILCMQQFYGIPYRKWFKYNEYIEILMNDAGHILGSANITLKITENGKVTYLGFSGDIGRPNRPILKDPESMPTLDYLIMESTYGGEVHPSKSNEEYKFIEIISDCCLKKKGKLLIPAFSVGRTQELIYMLNKLSNENKIPKINVYIDSPLSVNATQIFEMHRECFDNEIMQLMQNDETPFNFNGLKYIREAAQSKKLNDSKEPCIIISASGMAQAGRIKHHIANNIEKQNTTILFVGYCSTDTLGHTLKQKPNTVTIFGKTLKVNATIESLESLSAHADELEMLQFISNQSKSKLKKIFLVHGEPERQNKFSPALSPFSNEIILPKLSEIFHLKE
jgi:metallo-beta-lactamase family protein